MGIWDLYFFDGNDRYIGKRLVEIPHSEDVEDYRKAILEYANEPYAEFSEAVVVVGIVHGFEKPIMVRK